MKDTLLVICSESGFTQRSISFLEEEYELTEDDYVLLALPGSAHLIGMGHHLPHCRRAAEYFINFLKEQNNLKRVLILDHEECDFFKSVAPMDSVFWGKSQAEAMVNTLKAVRALLPWETKIVSWMAKRHALDTQYRKIE